LAAGRLCAYTALTKIGLAIELITLEDLCESVFALFSATLFTGLLGVYLRMGFL
jgi:hypothetical protein